MQVYCNHHNLQGTCTEEDYNDALYGRNPSRMVRVEFESFTHAVPVNTLTVIPEEEPSTFSELMAVEMQQLSEDEEIDDWEGERNFMREESKYRDLSEDEHIIYGI